YPVRLELPETGEELDAARAVRRQLQQIPHQGMGFEILANYSPSRQVRKLLSRGEPPIRLNYTGDMDRTYAGLSVLQQATEWGEALVQAASRSERIPRRLRLDTVVGIRGGEIHLVFMYHNRAYLRSTVER